MLAGIQLLVGSSLSVSQCPSSVGRWLAVRHDIGLTTKDALHGVLPSLDWERQRNVSVVL